MFHLLFGLILIAQAGQQPNAPKAAKAPAPIQVPYREVWEHLPAEKFPFLRTSAAVNTFSESIPVETMVDAEGNVIAAKAQPAWQQS